MSNIITSKILYKLALETANKISLEQNKLKNIKWTEGEANLDTEFSKLACECCVNSWNQLKSGTNYQNIQIQCSIPDINIKFILPNNQVIYKKIELKSSTKNIIPGSTINNLDINQPLIFCLRPNDKNGIYQIRCSLYHHAMGTNDYETFQDRTPRPKINFNKMEPLDNYQKYQKKSKSHWINHYAECALNRVNNNCNHSWQDDLVKQIQHKTINNYIKNTSLEDFMKMKNQMEQ